jgi:hypothetical protein
LYRYRGKVELLLENGEQAVDRLFGITGELRAPGEAQSGAVTMSAPEPLCDLRIIKADYRLVGHKDREPDHCFRISTSE